MPGNNSNDGWSTQDLEQFRALQEEMLNLSRDYAQRRTRAWAEETRSLTESWNGFFQDWQGGLERTATLATARFSEVAAQGQSSSDSLAQSWQQALTGMSGEVDDWSGHFLDSLEKIAAAWSGNMGDMNGGGGGFLSSLLGFGGLFHQGGMVTAHQGMVVPTGALASDEQLILAQTGEGILPRESMTQLGDSNFEALRTGRFELAPAGSGPRVEVTIQVQSLDAAGVAGMDWDRLVQRHLLPALQRELGARW
jgi:hypothetical protein